ncbi:MAG: hypothetical protein HY023_03435 [Chloroflexi bacterium]|nr:hypothetical protein [Chloroflexota bacterium]
MPALFSSGPWAFADDNDETGLRFYAVIGKVDTDRPQIAARVGVYGHHWRVSATAVFDGLGPFVDTFGKDNDDKDQDTEPAG